MSVISILIHAITCKLNRNERFERGVSVRSLVERTRFLSFDQDGKLIQVNELTRLDPPWLQMHSAHNQGKPCIPPHQACIQRVVLAALHLDS